MIDMLKANVDNMKLSDKDFREFMRNSIPSWEREIDRLEKLSYNERYEAKITRLEGSLSDYGWEESVRNGHK